MKKISLLWKRLWTKTPDEILWDEYVMNSSSIEELKRQLRTERRNVENCLNEISNIKGQIEASHKYILNIDNSIQSFKYTFVYFDRGNKEYTLETISKV